MVLADLELRRDSLGTAIRILQPVADLSSGSPLAFTAAAMIASAFEQGGDTERSLNWHRRIEDGARFDYQRAEAMAARARILTAAGDYDAAATLYERLVAEAEEDPSGQNIYTVRLGEVLALRESGAAPPAAVPEIASAPAEQIGEGAETGDATPAEAP